MPKHFASLMRAGLIVPLNVNTFRTAGDVPREWEYILWIDLDNTLVRV